MQRSALCRSRRELSNEYLLAKIGVDTAENELLEVLFNSIQYYSFVSFAGRRAGTAAASVRDPTCSFAASSSDQRRLFAAALQYGLCALLFVTTQS